MRLGFLITARCNAACQHCSTSCGPERAEALPTGKILSLMVEAADIWRRERLPGEALQYSISGGEPFLDPGQLREIVAHGRSLGATVSCVTNGYWATSDGKARATLQPLKQAGLGMLAVSTSRFHQRFVKRERVERALRIAGELGLRTALKCALTAGDRAGPGGLEQWARTRRVDQLEIFPVMPHLRNGFSLPEDEYVRKEPLPEGPCPAPMITVREDGRAYMCCMPGAFTGLLELGDTHDTSLERIHDRFYLNGTQQLLRRSGPARFARAIVAAGEGWRLRRGYESVCDLCTHIASDPRMSAIAEREGRAFARAQSLRALAKLALRSLGRIAGIGTDGLPPVAAGRVEGAITKEV